LYQKSELVTFTIRLIDGKNLGYFLWEFDVGMLFLYFLFIF